MEVSENPIWFQVDLPAAMTWSNDPVFWRGVIVAECRKSDPSAFTGRNLLSSFVALHSVEGVVLDLILMLIDVPRERIAIAAFPSFIGPTIGSGLADPTIGDDPSAQEAAAAAETRELERYGLSSLSVVGTDGSNWRVVFDVFDARPEGALGPDGHTLTRLGTDKVAGLVEGTVLAASSWLPRYVEGPPSLVHVRIEHRSPATGPTLRQSLTG